MTGHQSTEMAAVSQQSADSAVEHTQRHTAANASTAHRIARRLCLCRVVLLQSACVLRGRTSRLQCVDVELMLAAVVALLHGDGTDRIAAIDRSLPLRQHIQHSKLTHTRQQQLRGQSLIAQQRRVVGRWGVRCG